MSSYPIAIGLQRRNDILYCSRNMNASNQTEAFAIGVCFQSFIQRRQNQAKGWTLLKQSEDRNKWLPYGSPMLVWFLLKLANLAGQSLQFALHPTIILLNL